MDTPILEIDPRIKRLSHSSRETLAKCPRKFQLYRLNSKEEVVEDGGVQEITFAFGHSVGLGIQHILEGYTFEQTAWKLFLAWECDLLARDDKAGKNFFAALAAIKKFALMREAGFYKDYELVTYEGKPAVELSFAIRFPDGFVYRGYVDAVLRHKTTGEVLVLECKTTKMTTVNPAQFKNSGQAIGYSIVLDVLFPELSSYKVLYLVYQTKSLEYVALPFTKSYHARAVWINELMLDIETIKLYEQAKVYPMRGHNCYSFFRECEYMNLCTLNTSHLIKPYVEEEDTAKDEQFQVDISLLQLLEAQLNKAAQFEKLPQTEQEILNADHTVVEL